MKKLTFSTPTDSVIEKQVYTNTSLSEDIDFLSNGKKQYTLDTIINVVVKSLYGYRHPGSVNERVNLTDIMNQLNQWRHFVHITDKINFHANKEEKLALEEIVDQFDSDEFGFYKKNQYAIRMHSDIASTTELVSHIIEQKIEDVGGGGEYMSIDFGSGSGILTEAQYIQARRNGFSTIHNVGLEFYDTHVRNSEELLKNLNVGKIIEGNTIDHKLYEVLNESSTFINYISNETIPRKGSKMSSRWDPFYWNIVNISDHLGHRINGKTKMFPEMLEVHVSTTHFPEVLVGNLSNRFQFDELDLIQQERDLLFRPHESVLDYTTPQAISIKNNQLQPLTTIGDSVLNTGKVHRSNYDARRR